MNKPAIFFAVAMAVAACNNSSAGSSAATSSVDSATKAAPDTIKPAAIDTGAMKVPTRTVAPDTAK